MKKTYKSKIIGDGLTIETAFRPQIFDDYSNNKFKCSRLIVGDEVDGELEVIIEADDNDHKKIKDLKYKEK